MAKKKIKVADLPEGKVEKIAEICHEANRAYCRQLGDPSQKPWNQTTKGQKDSVMTGVRKILNGETKRPQDSHAAWLRWKEVNGWKRGPKKDEAKKEHPNMVKFKELPEDEKVKDFLFFNIARTLAEHQFYVEIEKEVED